MLIAPFLVALAATAAAEGVPASRPPPEVEAKLWSWSTKEARQILESGFDAASADHLTVMARVLEQEGRYDEAAARLTRACEMVPNDPQPWLSLGEVRQRQENAKAAGEAFERALALTRTRLESDAASAMAHYQMGVALRGLKRYEEAAASLSRARELRPEDPLVDYQLGLTRALQERWQPALEALNRALERNTGIAYGYYYRGLAKGQLGQKAAMLEDLDRFVFLAPHAPEAERARRVLQSARR